MMLDLVEELGLQGLRGRFRGANDIEIKEIEQQIGFGLSNAYKEFLKNYGASVFTRRIVFKPLEPSPWAAEGRESLDGFYGVSEDHGFDLRAVDRSLRGDIPCDTIAIGNDAGSNLVLLASNGEVLFFDRETGETYLCAKDFEAFINSFRLRGP